MPFIRPNDLTVHAQFDVVHAAAHILCAERPIAFNELLLRFLEAA
jgi:pimeloyl-ACP methyl ester carboxylesterase